MIQVYRTYKPWFNYNVMIIYVIQIDTIYQSLDKNTSYKLLQKKIITSLLSAQVWQEMNQSGQKYSKVISNPERSLSNRILLQIHQKKKYISGDSIHKNVFPTAALDFLPSEVSWFFKHRGW